MNIKRRKHFIRLLVSAGAGIAWVMLFWLMGGRSAAVVAAPTDRYVRPEGIDTGMCTLSTDPCATVQFAVDVADAGDRILVAGGTYTDVHARMDGSQTYTQVVFITKTVSLLGGYNDDFSIRDPEVYDTNLAPQQRGRAVTLLGSGSPVVDGFVIIGGDADAGGTLAQGGGVLAIGGSGPALTVTLENNTILFNRALSSNGSGAGLSFIFSNAFLENNGIGFNDAAANGGGLRAEQSNLSMRDNVIRYNRAASGGAMYFSTLVSAEMTNTVLADNQALTYTPGVYLGGSSVRMAHSTVARNIGGDGIGIYAGFGFFAGPTTLSMTNSIVVSQTVGITVTEGTAFLTSTAKLDGVLWYDNSINIGGGGDFTVMHAYTDTPAFDIDGIHLLPGSGAIDRGVSVGVDEDFEGDLRFAPPDLGADEYVVYVFLPLTLRD